MCDIYIFNGFIRSMETNKTVSLSIPKNVLNKIDTNRGDVNRSRYILRLIESNFEDNNSTTTKLETLPIAK